MVILLVGMVVCVLAVGVGLVGLSLFISEVDESDGGDL